MTTDRPDDAAETEITRVGDGTADTVETVERVETVETGAPGVPLGGPGTTEQAVEHETEVIRPRADGSVETERVRVAERRRSPVESAAAGVLVLLLLAAAALAGWWFLVRDDAKQVPAVVGLDATAAVARVEDDGFDARTTTQPNEAPAGQVVSQDPQGGTDADQGTDVQLVVSGGPATVAVPNAVGLTEADARDRLVAAGFQVTSREVFSPKPAGSVIAQHPAAGVESDPATEVTINVSKGTGMVSVPSVVGQTRADAEAALSDAGLKANVYEVPSADPAGTVVAQNPVGGQLRRGEAVRVNVSTGTP